MHTYTLGRILVGFLFFFFGVWNILHRKSILEFMQQKNIPLAFPFLILGLAWQTLFGFYIVIGLWVQLSALMLIPFTIVSVFIFHAFWNFEGEIRRLNMILFIANLTGSLGGLILLL
jgi:uncharacterized membrane protein YphA (DoxX/SURF4 family)